MMIERRCPVKTMRLRLTPGERLVPIMDSSLHSPMHVYNLVFEAEAFLYKLIRRITGTLIHIAKGQMNRQDVLERFACPPDYYNSSLPVTLKPHGLYLYEVKYNEQDFLHPTVLATHNMPDNDDDELDRVLMEVQEDEHDDDSDLLTDTIETRR
jgi:hypothetical protein